MAFVHLGIHSEYSITDSIVRIKPLIKAAAADDQRALALTDLSNLYATVKFYRACLGAGIKPIIGCEVYVARRRMEDRVHGIDNDPYHLVLLCENRKGYENLCLMVSEAFTRGFYGKPRVDLELLEKYHEGLIATSACLAGGVAQYLM
ncbi:MAG: PHP domain-containing protein, partial [Psychrobacter sp.]|nr:PHP domain-containing protein [Psychrobacter sp.]